MIISPHKKDIYDVVGRNIKKYRKLQHMTQLELSKKSGYSYSFIRRIESSTNQKNFSLQTIYNISLALNINITNLFDDIYI